MAEKGFTRIPVVERTTTKFLGLVSLNDLVKTRAAFGATAPTRTNPATGVFLRGRRGREETHIAQSRTFDSHRVQSPVVTLSPVTKTSM